MYKLNSVLIYLSIFIISILLTKSAERSLIMFHKTECKSQRLKYKIKSLLAIIIPCLLAGFRGIDVGTDAIRYNAMYELAFSYDNLSDYILAMSTRDIEKGYSFCNFILSRFKITTTGMFFFYEFLSMVPVYIVLEKHKYEYPMWTGLAVFYAFFYNLSFNAIRQCVSVSFILLFYHLLIERKYLLTIISLIVALSFHSSAYIGAVFVLAAIVLTRFKVTGIQQVIIFFVFLIIASSPLYMDKIFDILHDVGLLSKRQSFYQALFSGEKVIVGTEKLNGGGYAAILFRVIVLLFPLYDLLITKKIQDPNIKEPVIVVLMGTIFYVFSSLILNTIHVYRITLYSEIFYVIYVPYLYKIIDERHKFGEISLKSLYFIGIISIYWYWIFIRIGYHGTSNYFLNLM